MKKIEKSVLIDAPVDQVFAFVTDPNNLPSIWPSMVEVKNVKTDAAGAHSFDFTYKMAGLHFQGHADTLEAEKNRHVVTKSVGGIPSTFDWLYTSKDGKTELKVRTEYELPKNVLAKLAEPIVHHLNEREAETMLHNLKAVMEAAKAQAAE